jgi:hypothetical protein
MNDKADKEFAELQLKAICPNADQWPTEFLHQKALVAAANEARAFVRDAFTKLDQIDANRDLTPEAKKLQRAKLATEILVKMQASQTPSRVREAVEDVIQKWQQKIDANLKPATDAQQVSVYSQVRDRLYNMKGGRLSWLEGNMDDTLMSAVLTAPAYLSGLTEAEYGFVRQQLERRAPPEIVDARTLTKEMLAEVERGWRAGMHKIGVRGGLHKAVDGTWSDAA